MYSEQNILSSNCNFEGEASINYNLTVSFDEVRNLSQTDISIFSNEDERNLGISFDPRNQEIISAS
jgi:hypothetical protein